MRNRIHIDLTNTERKRMMNKERKASICCPKLLLPTNTLLPMTHTTSFPAGPV